jgi:formylglycine-generating enzyme required for sulfatase activity
MGSPSSEEGRYSNELQHEVVLSRGLFLAETECTQGQWEAVMGSNPSNLKGRDRPVEQVSWEEAVEFCRKLTAKQRQEGVLPEGWEWRLPTESEWEYAARAGTTGARHGELDAIAWHGGNSGSETHGVKGKQANAWGLYDMVGNVWEWCGDWYGDYPTGSVTDPTGPGSGSLRMNRGGVWNGGARNARSAFRNWCVPGNRNSFLGFRPALSSVR